MGCDEELIENSVKYIDMNQFYEHLCAHYLDKLVSTAKNGFKDGKCRECFQVITESQKRKHFAVYHKNVLKLVSKKHQERYLSWEDQERENLVWKLNKRWLGKIKLELKDLGTEIVI